MLDDLRSGLDDSFEDDESEVNSPFNFDELISEQEEASTAKDGKFLGMTAGERAFLSVMVFLVVLVFGIAILAVTGRIVF